MTYIYDYIQYKDQISQFIVSNAHVPFFSSIDATIDNSQLGRLVNDDVGLGENCIMKTVKVANTQRLCLFAKRDIIAGEELRFDYGVDDLPWRQVWLA